MNQQDQNRVDSLRQARGWVYIKRFAQNPVRGDVPEWKEMRNTIRSRLGMSGVTFALMGGCGVGKTQLAVDLMLWMTHQMKTAEYTTAMGFYQDLKDTYGRDDGPSEGAVLKSFDRPALLVIDEFEKRPEQKWHQHLMFELLNRRYGNCTDTIILTNLPGKVQFYEYVGRAIAQRIEETGGILTCNWKSFRG